MANETKRTLSAHEVWNSIVKMRLSPGEAWDSVIDVVLRDEALRLEALSDEELDREVAAIGRDPAAERARGWELAARALAKVAKAKAARSPDPRAWERACGWRAGRRPGPEETWEVIMHMVREDEAERLAGLSKEELRREFAQMGLDPDDARKRRRAVAEYARLIATKAAMTPDPGAQKESNQGPRPLGRSRRQGVSKQNEKSTVPDGKSAVPGTCPFEERTGEQ